MAYSDRVISAESGGNPNATNGNSTASGPAGFTNGTWLETIRKNRPDLAGLPDDQLLALKKDPALAGQMADAYRAANEAILAKSGLPVTAGTSYLAHFAGPHGAVKVLQADPNTPVSAILSVEAIRANPFLRGMTAQGLHAWAGRKMGVQAPALPGQPTVPSSPPAAGEPAAPTMPTARPPIFASAPTAAPAVPSIPATDPAVQAPPISMPAARPIDLSGLRAALAARAPIFANRQGIA